MFTRLLLPLKIFVPLLFFLVCAKTPFAQEKTTIIIKHSDRFIGEKQADGNTVNILTGNVILEQDSTLFYCDSARLYKDVNNLDAFGSVHVLMNDSVELFGDRLFYNGNTKLADVYDNVILIDTMATLYTNHLTYNRNTKTAFYKNWGRIVDEDNILVSVIGYYYTQQKEFFFKDSVVLTNPDYIINADTLMYNTETEIVYFKGPTTLTGEEDYMFAYDGWYDTRQDMASLKDRAHIRHNELWIWGDSLYYDKPQGFSFAYDNAFLLDTIQEVAILGNIIEHYKNEGYAFATDSALAILIDGRDSLFMHADTLRLIFDSTDKVKDLHAYNKVKFFRKDLQGASDSLIYQFNDSCIVMHNNPVLWSDENQLTSDSMKIYITNNAMDSLVLYNNSFIVSQDDSANFNQIKGRNVIGYFRNNELYKITVSGNSETIYYLLEETGELIGINKAEASNMVIHIIDKEMRTIIYLDKPKATLYPENEITPAEQKLKGFKWLDNQRPRSKEEIFITD